MHQHECGIFDARSCHGHRRRPRCHHVQSGNDHAWWCKQPLWWGASCEVVDKFSEHVIAKQKRMHRRMDITSTNRIDASRATTSCRPRGPCIWYAFYDNVVLYLVCTYVARIAEPIGGLRHTLGGASDHFWSQAGAGVCYSLRFKRQLPSLVRGADRARAQGMGGERGGKVNSVCKIKTQHKIATNASARRKIAMQADSKNQESTSHVRINATRALSKML